MSDDNHEPDFLTEDERRRMAERRAGERRSSERRQ
jgi:hypothetical protein